MRKQYIYDCQTFIVPQSAVLFLYIGSIQSNVLRYHARFTPNTDRKKHRWIEFRKQSLAYVSICEQSLAYVFYSYNSHLWEKREERKHRIAKFEFIIIIKF